MFWGGSGSGGLDQVNNDLVRYLPAAGMRVIGVVEGPPGADAESGGLVRLFGPERGGFGRRPRAVRHTVAAVLREQPVDLAALHLAMYGVFVIDKLRRQPLAMRFHGPWSTESRTEGGPAADAAAKRAIEMLVLRLAGRVIVLSQAVAALARQEFGVSGDRIRVVPGYVDLDWFACGESRAEARDRLGLPNDRANLVTIRRLKQRMGLERLLKAVVPVASAIPGVLLCIGGIGPLRSAHEQRATDLGLASQVRFLGRVPEDGLPLLFRAADLNVVPTLALEGFGLVAAEALAAGKPSMVTPVGGLPDVASPLSEALAFASSEPADMADRLIAALRGRLRLPDAGACQAYASRAFPVSLAGARTADVYRGLLA